ncbi:MAG TPA: tetratricopeptide repeat protein [Burkholderiaceae bacterium]|nr:tetratricopeptide repeat protein [Burkholderiaceae bacterium]
MASTPNNLAQQLNSFVGRDREMDEVRRLLAQNRLLTLLGMGGLGKSRLSVQVAATVLDDYADGVWLVELAALADPLRVPQAVAAVLGVKEEPGGTVLDALIRFVRDRRMLIVLDNCEHVVQSCAELAKRLLEAASGVTILASSRDSLRIAGETIFQVLPLPTPIESKDHVADVLLAIDSVRLFIDRAQAVQPGFRLTDGTARAVAEICRRLDGIPLAIELAAARVRAMTVDQIASRLDDRFKLLSRGDRAVLPRQQTLRALIDWSYDLLVEEERVLFKRLAVFAAGWTLEAAEAVTAGEGLDRESVLDLLCNLVEKSLVVHDVSRGRYRMLETVREYALEKLRDSSDEAVTRERHLAFFVGYVEHALPFLFGPEQAEWLTALDADRENLFCAHRWCDSSVAGSEAAIRLVAVEKYYWLNRGLLSQGYGIARAALERPALQDSPENYCVALTDVGAIGYFIGQYVQARDDLKRGLELARELGNRSRQISVLQLLGLVEFALGKGEAALDYCNEAERLARESRNPREIMSALTAKGQLLRAIGRTEDARDLYSEALNCARALGDEESIAASLLNLAAVAVDCGKPEGACAMLGEVSAITTRIGSRAAGQSLLEVCAGLAMSRGDVGRATAFLEAAETEAATSGLRRDPADEAFILKVKTALHGLVGAGARGERAPAAPRSFEESLDRASHWLASGCPAAHEDSRAAHSAVD